MIASIQITSTKIFALIAVLVFKLLSFINIKDNGNCQKSRLSFKKIANFTVKLRQNYK